MPLSLTGLSRPTQGFYRRVQLAPCFVVWKISRGLSWMIDDIPTNLLILNTCIRTGSVFETRGKYIMNFGEINQTRARMTNMTPSGFPGEGGPFIGRRGGGDPFGSTFGDFCYDYGSSKSQKCQICYDYGSSKSQKRSTSPVWVDVLAISAMIMGMVLEKMLLLWVENWKSAMIMG